MSKDDEFERWWQKNELHDGSALTEHEKNVAHTAWLTAVRTQKAKDLAAVEVVAQRCVDTEDVDGNYACRQIRERINSTD